jgi:NAD(P)-dependent dehydrogenase (short-subunit alcohol dehydrogenase family)
MQIDLAGRSARVGGATGRVGDAIAAALAANGASLLAPDADAPVDILVLDARTGIAPGDAAGISREAGTRMAAAGWGRIVLLVGVSGVVAARGEMAASVDAAAVLQAMRVLAMQLGPRGVLVNAVAVAPLAGEPLAARTLSHTPLGRPPTVDEVAGAVLFLTDPDNSYTAGHVLTVDGGWTAGFARDF